AVARATDGDSGLVTDQVADVARQSFLDLLGRQDRDRGRHGVEVALAARCRDDERLELAAILMRRIRRLGMTWSNGGRYGKAQECALHIVRPCCERRSHGNANHSHWL